MWPGLEFGSYRNDVTAVMASPGGNSIYRLLTKCSSYGKQRRRGDYPHGRGWGL